MQRGERFPVRSCCSGACESAVNAIRVFTNAATLIQNSIPVVLRLVGAFHRHADVVGLFLGELGELHADFFQVQPGRDRFSAVVVICISALRSIP
jgi:hypothetical protein